jgi:hypothetical protein
MEKLGRDDIPLLLKRLEDPEFLEQDDRELAQNYVKLVQE